MDGYALCRKLKESAETKEIPILFLSALLETNQKIKGLECGAVDFINTSSDYAKILARIQTHLNIRDLNKQLHQSNRELLLKQKILHDDLKAAAMIQRSLLPMREHRIPYLNISWVCEPCEFVGGDICNVFQMDEKQSAFYVLDVSGHGVPSAMITVSIVQCIQQKRAGNPYLHPHEAVASLNKEFPFESFNNFFTLFYMLVDTEEKKLSFSSAGHPPAVLLRKNTSYQLLSTDCPLIGVFPDYYPAEGQTIEADHTFNPYVRGIASATRKNYFNRFPTRYTCLATLWFNLYDYLYAGIGFEKKNEIYNYFSLTQGIQSKITWATLRAISHAWVIESTYQHYDYNDQNTQEHMNLMASYILSEDPVTFKLIANANYRNAAHPTEIVTDPQGQLLTIIHPYWTPANYYAESLTLEFRYNYAWFTYCEAPQRYIDLKLTGENDTAHNPSFQLIFNWKHEWMRHLGFDVTVLYHRSKLWNADGIWTQVYYRF
ncbi:MAG: SpoIIE family protein phosphatase [Parachlamydia sp.]|nr:SpoIIE family protein phosphatase [Parachlamydia sp.]